MKIFFTLLFCILFQTGFTQSTESYFEKIKNNEAELTAFFSQMSKGGDLHHHYSGSIYPEPLLAHAITKDFYLNTQTMTVSPEKQSGSDWVQFSILQKNGELDTYKHKIMQKWSVKDYWLHMVMFKYCHSRFPKVKYTMHAGELNLGLVRPEELSWHINGVVYIAGTNRIGHGVDMAYEEKSYDLMRYMAKNNIPIEINLSSNEFILKVKEYRHPILLYKEFGVPIVICTDDAGILRTNMTEQYVLVA